MRISDWSSDVCSSDLSLHQCFCLFSCLAICPCIWLCLSFQFDSMNTRTFVRLHLYGSLFGACVIPASPLTAGSGTPGGVCMPCKRSLHSSKYRSRKSLQFTKLFTPSRIAHSFSCSLLPPNQTQAKHNKNNQTQ